MEFSGEMRETGLAASIRGLPRADRFGDVESSESSDDRWRTGTILSSTESYRVDEKAAGARHVNASLKLPENQRFEIVGFSLSWDAFFCSTAPRVFFHPDRHAKKTRTKKMVMCHHSLPDRPQSTGQEPTHRPLQPVAHQAPRSMKEKNECASWLLPEPSANPFVLDKVFRPEGLEANPLSDVNRTVCHPIVRLGRCKLVPRRRSGTDSDTLRRNGRTRPTAW
jgi:hypothetical protein